MAEVTEWPQTLPRPEKSSGQLRYTTTFRRKALLLRMRSIGLGCWLVGGLLTSQAATHIWTGTGNSARWSNAANWQGNNPPQSGELGAVLVFPPDVSRLSSSNDLTGLAVAQLVFSGTNHALNGTNALILSADLGDSITASGGSNFVAMPLILQTTNSFRVATNASLALAGQLTGPGAFTLVGGGSLALMPAGGVDNTYQGTTRVLEGTLLLASGYTNIPIFGGKLYAVAAPGPVVVGDTNSVAPAVLRGMAMSPNTALTILGSGQYLVSGDLLAVGSLAGDGFVDCQDQSFIVGGNNRSTIFGGRINGSSDAGLQKVGTGTLALTGGDVGPVQLIIEEGTLTVDGSFPNSMAVVGSAMNGLAGGRLEGNGSLGTIFAEGPFSPGHDGPGRLTAAMVFMDLDSSLVVRLGGTNAGIDYDQVVAKETFELVDPSAALKVQMLPGFVGTVGNQYTIVRLDSTNAVEIPLVPQGNTNGFNGLGEGSVFTLTNGAAFRISYQGGDGNDVVLTQTALPVQPIMGGVSRLNGGEVQITGLGYMNAIYTIWANTELTATNWMTIGTVTANGSGVLQFADLSATNYPKRFYRLSWP